MSTRSFLFLAVGSAALLALHAASRAGDPGQPPAPPAQKPAPGANGANTTTHAGGWRPLFDGRTTQGWRGFGKPGFPERGWAVEDGVLKKIAGVHGGDIVSVETFDDFELEWEWRIPPKANNGVKYFILEERGSPIGHEYQMIDNAEAPAGKHQTASFYDVLPPRAGLAAPRIGDWNASRIVVRGSHVEHWLNGTLVLSYELGSAEVVAGIAQSKFKDVPGFGTKVRGHILLTDHNDEAWFRNIRVRTPGGPNPP
jgi:hypothetical protein